MIAMSMNSGYMWVNVIRPTLGKSIMQKNLTDKINNFES